MEMAGQGLEGWKWQDRVLKGACLLCIKLHALSACCLACLVGVFIMSALSNQVQHVTV